MHMLENTKRPLNWGVFREAPQLRSWTESNKSPCRLTPRKEPGLVVRKKSSHSLMNLTSFFFPPLLPAGSPRGCSSTSPTDHGSQVGLTCAGPAREICSGCREKLERSHLFFSLLLCSRESDCNQRTARQRPTRILSMSVQVIMARPQEQCHDTCSPYEDIFLIEIDPPRPPNQVLVDEALCCG